MLVKTKDTGMKKIMMTALAALFIISLFIAASPQSALAVSKSALDMMKMESLKDGRKVPLGSLMKGKPFYIVMSTPT